MLVGVGLHENFGVFDKALHGHLDGRHVVEGISFISFLFRRQGSTVLFAAAVAVSCGFEKRSQILIRDVKNVLGPSLHLDEVRVQLLDSIAFTFNGGGR